jgi:hypothetical protein
MSFLNPGDRETEDADVLPDACAGYDCGEHGRCTAMNMTPTCVCDQGFVGVTRTNTAGDRRVTCTAPDDAVPAAFYDKRLAPLPVELPGGRDVGVPEVVPMATPTPTPATVPVTPLPGPPSAAFPMPRANPDYPASTPGSPASASAGSNGGCGLAQPSGDGAALAGLAALLLGAAGWRRGRRSS